MTGLELILIALALWCVREITVGTMTWFQRLHLRHQLRIERIRFAFGCARGELMLLAARGGLDTRSVTFRILYRLTTFVMRRPDQFAAISRSIREAFSERETWMLPRPDLVAEARTWSPEVRSVVRAIGQAFGDLLLAYSWPLRLLTRFAGRLKVLPTIQSFVRALEVPIEEAFERRHSDAAVIRNTEEQIRELCVAGR